MPFTPLHMGPGLVIKAALQKRFSILVFGWSQINTDLQPLVYLMTGSGTYHGFSHTYIGAVFIALYSAVTGKFLFEIGLSGIGLQNHIPLRWKTCFLSAFIGTYSHVFLDGLTHIDMFPFRPFSLTNPFLGYVDDQSIYIFCIFSAIIGGIANLLISYIQNKTRQIRH